jgi:acylphosphatase
MKKHYSITVQGRVQGVFFRQSTHEEAQKLGLNGTVQNLPDGSVEIHAEGNEEKLNQLLDWCKNGPQHARVTSLEYSEENLKNYQNFKII